MTIRSSAENNLVRDLANSLPTPEDVWIGASDQTKEGDWHWYADGVQDNDERFWVGGIGGTSQPGFYENWRSDEPTGGPTNDDFARLERSTGQWRDTPVSVASNSYVVEWDAAEVLAGHTFNLTDNANGRFVIDSITGDITVADGSLLDFETDTTHNLSLIHI